MNQQVTQHGARHNAQKSARTSVFTQPGQENARIPARTTVIPRSGQKNARNSAPHTWIFLPGRGGVGEEVAEWRSGEKERRREGEKEKSAKDLGFTTGKCHGGRSVGVCCKLTGVEGGVFYSKPPPKGFQGWSLKI